MRQCEIYLHGIKCGLLTEEDDKSFTFSYDSVFAERTITNIMKAEFAGQMVVADTKPHYNIR